MEDRWYGLLGAYGVSASMAQQQQQSQQQQYLAHLQQLQGQQMPLVKGAFTQLLAPTLTEFFELRERTGWDIENRKPETSSDPEWDEYIDEQYNELYYWDQQLKGKF